MERDRFEELLCETLRRVEPPADLEARILRSLRWRRARRRSVWLRIAAAVVLAITGWFALRWQQERRREQQALEVRRQLEFALQVTYDRLSEVDRELNRIGVREVRFEEAGP